MSPSIKARNFATLAVLSSHVHLPKTIIFFIIIQQVKTLNKQIFTQTNFRSLLRKKNNYNTNMNICRPTHIFRGELAADQRA